MHEAPALTADRANPAAPEDASSSHFLRIREAIVQMLTSEQRLLILLRHAERMSWAEIGEVLGLSADRVEQLHAQAVTCLRAAG